MILKTNFVPPGFAAITLWPFILVRPQYADNPRLIQHERIHLAQQIECFLIFFYLWYLIEFLIKLIKYKDWMTAYKAIGFEREAGKWDNWIDYLENRKHFYWIKYL